MRVRLRDTPDLSALYTDTYDHTKWKDHITRVRLTASLASWFPDVDSAADLSCGDGAILRYINDYMPIRVNHYGDMVSGHEFTGPIEETLKSLPNVDLFILSETIEHLDDPDLVLRMLREKTRYLILSTPDGETGTDNPEHLWGWDTDGIREMLRASGFTPNTYTSLSFPINPYYTFQIWGCS